MKVLLVNPPSGLYIREDRCQAKVADLLGASVRPPLDLAYMAAMVRQAGGEAWIADLPAMGWGKERFLDILGRAEPDLLVASVTSFTMTEDMDFLAYARQFEPGMITVAKGAHFLSEDLRALRQYPQLDIVIRGEYEDTLEELARGKPLGRIKGISYRKGGRLTRNPERALRRDLDGLPYPARDLLDNRLYVRPDTGEMQTTVQTGRGCPYSCIYCLAPPFSGKQLRQRSPRDVLEELKECRERQGINNFFFRADTFTLKREWVLEMCGLIEKELPGISWVCNSRTDSLDEERCAAMRRAGCWGVALGVESGSQMMLDKMKKKACPEDARRAVRLCGENGLKTLLYFIIGLPWETKDTLRQTGRLARELKGDFYDFHIAIPYPGTELDRLVKKEGLFTQAGQGSGYGEAVLRSRELSSRELLAWRKKLLRSVYLRPSFIYRKLISLGSPLSAWRQVRYAISKLGWLLR